MSMFADRPFYGYSDTHVLTGEEVNKICDGKFKFTIGLQHDMTASYRSNSSITYTLGLNIAENFTDNFNNRDGICAFLMMPKLFLILMVVY